MHVWQLFIACLVMLMTYTADQLWAFNHDVDVSVPRSARKAIFSLRLWHLKWQRKYKQDLLRWQPIVIPLKRTDNLTIRSVNFWSIGNKAISYENVDILVIIIIYITFNGPYEDFVWPIWTFCLAKMALAVMVLAKSTLADMVFGRIGHSPLVVFIFFSFLW